MKAVKANKEYTIDESQQKQYQESGFDIKDAAGTVVAYGRGKTVPYEEHIKAIKEIAALRVRISELEAEAPVKEEKKAGTKKAGE